MFLSLHIDDNAVGVWEGGPYGEMIGRVKLCHSADMSMIMDRYSFPMEIICLERSSKRKIVSLNGFNIRVSFNCSSEEAMALESELSTVILDIEDKVLKGFVLPYVSDLLNYFYCSRSADYFLALVVSSVHSV